VSEVCASYGSTSLNGRHEVGAAGIQKEWNTNLKTCELGKESGRNSVVTLYVFSESMYRRT
jgi:hypothetical protein